jgi:hypothetical protein
MALQGRNHSRSWGGLVVTMNAVTIGAWYRYSRMVTSIAQGRWNPKQRIRYSGHDVGTEIMRNSKRNCSGMSQDLGI